MAVNDDVMERCLPVGDAQSASPPVFTPRMLWPGNGIKGKVISLLTSYSLSLSDSNIPNSIITSLRSRLEELERAAYPEHPTENSDVEIQCSAQDMDIPHEFLSIEDDSNETNLSTTHQITVLPTEAHNTGTAQLEYNILSDEIDFSTEAGASNALTLFEHSIGGDDFLTESIRPCNFEELMRPISKAIMRKADLAATAQVPSLGQSTHAGDIIHQPAKLSCRCPHLLNTMRCNFPIRRHADSLVNNYFSRHHRMYPILHKETFMAQYESLWASTKAAQGELGRSCIGICRQKSHGRSLPALVCTVLALGCLFDSPSPAKNADEAETLFRLAQDIDLLEILDHEVGLELVQLGLLMAFFLQTTERFSKCWIISGLTIRMAQIIGLHLSIPTAQRRGLLSCCLSQLDTEIRKRVWHGCVMLEM